VEYAERAHEFPELDHPVPLEIKHIEHLPYGQDGKPTDRQIQSCPCKITNPGSERKIHVVASYPVREEIRSSAVPEQSEPELLLLSKQSKNPDKNTRSETSIIDS
jgi:hypothetical protein